MFVVVSAPAPNQYEACDNALPGLQQLPWLLLSAQVSPAQEGLHPSKRPFIFCTFHEPYWAHRAAQSMQGGPGRKGQVVNAWYHAYTCGLKEVPLA